jgi:hypothetical protein
LARLARSTALGALHVVGSHPKVVEAAAELAVRRARDGFRGIERCELAGECAVLKASPLRGKSALRWGLKRMLGARLPRVNEYDNLSWLTERLFATPLPLAAGGIVRGAIPRWQFLITRFVPEGVPLHDWFANGPTSEERAEVLDEIAREVARMHALRFVHRDLWTRNLLVVPRGGLSRVLFLDAWAGGPGLGWRGRRHDLECFASDMQRSWSADEAASWRARYEAEFRVHR